MRVNRFHIDEFESAKTGLAEIRLSRLGPVVAFVGKNGSGKTRILNEVERYLTSDLIAGGLLSHSIEKLPRNIQDAVPKFSEPEQEFLENHINIVSITKAIQQQPHIQQLRERLQHLNHERQRLLKRGGSPLHNTGANAANILNSIMHVASSILPRYVHRITLDDIKNLTITSGHEKEISFEKLIDRVAEENYNELGALKNSALKFLNKLPHELVYDRDEAYGDKEVYETKLAHRRFISLKNLVKQLLNKDLNWKKLESSKQITEEGLKADTKGIWTLNGRPFNYQEFSDGEKKLFGFCLLFFLIEQNENIRIKDSILIIDEPELNLHPRSEVMLIDGIRRLIDNSGQLWIATHSISILSHLRYNEIFLVKDGKIHPPGRMTPGDSLMELMGLEEHIQRLHYFINDIFNWAFLNFIVETFEHPTVIGEAPEKDPEIEIFHQVLQLQNGQTVLLDFGAGRGRLFKGLQLQNQGLKYYAFEPDETHHEELKTLSLSGVISSTAQLRENTFDIVVLCNVLHEIKITEWAAVLNSIKKTLKEKGKIVLIEDMQLPRGEKIEGAGFVILNIDAVKSLFSLHQAPQQFFSNKDTYRGRILCAVIEKETIGEINNESVLKSLALIKQHSLEKIRASRQKPSASLKDGIETAFYSQLYINCLFGEDILRLPPHQSEAGKNE